MANSQPIEIELSAMAEAAAESPLSSGSKREKSPSVAVIDKSLSATANLVKLLPTGTVLTFQALYTSFSNRGQCYPSNRYLTSGLILLCSLSCIIFSFTDTVVGRDGKLYPGIATVNGFYVFNHDDREAEVDEEEGEGKERAFGSKDLRRLRIRWLDYVHSFFSVLVFLTLTFSESDIVHCFFPAAAADAKQWLKNLPLGAGFLSSLVFMIFPTARKGIGYADELTPHAHAVH